MQTCLTNRNQGSCRKDGGVCNGTKTPLTRFAAETHQLFELPLAVAELLIHAEAHLRALQGGDDLQLRVFVLDDVVLQHQTQDLKTGAENRTRVNIPESSN